MGITLFILLTSFTPVLCAVKEWERYKKGKKRQNKYNVGQCICMSLGSQTPSHMAAQVQSLSSPQRLLWLAKKPSLWDTIFCFLVMRLIILPAIYSSFLLHLQTPNNLTSNHSKQTFFLLSLLYLLYLRKSFKKLLNSTLIFGIYALPTGRGALFMLS